MEGGIEDESMVEVERLRGWGGQGEGKEEG